MRPGRLDRILYVGPPDQKGREEILRIRMSKMSISPTVDVEEIAKMVSISAAVNPSVVAHVLCNLQTDGCSGAEISSLCQEAALLVMQKDMNAPHVSSTAILQTLLKQVPVG